MDSVVEELNELRGLTKRLGQEKRTQDAEELSARVWQVQLRLQAAWEAKEQKYAEARHQLSLIQAAKIKHNQDRVKLAEAKDLKPVDTEHLDLISLEEFLEANPSIDPSKMDEKSLLLARLEDEQQRRVELFQRRRLAEAKVNDVRRELEQTRAENLPSDRIVNLVLNARQNINKMLTVY